MPRKVLIAIAVAIASLGACAAGSSIARADPERDMRSLLALQTADLRVATISYRLASAGTAICPKKTSLTGLTLHGLSQYAPQLRDDARRAFGLDDRVAVLAVAPGSPADAAGLRAGDSIQAIGAYALPPAAPSRKASYVVVAAAYAALESAAGAGPVRIEAERADRSIVADLVPVEGCVSRIQLLPSPAAAARADGSILSITSGLLDFVASDDELALVIAHEMAHNVLGHRRILKAQGVRRGLFEGLGANAAKIRETEHAADRLAYFLMARAGFDAAAAPAFWARLYRGPARATSRSATHPDEKSRIEQARLAISEIADKRRTGRPLTP